jgi:cytochrome c oxidase subunit I+III
VGVLTFLGNVVRSARRGPLAGRDPWGADTLEWATLSPPPPYNFVRLPTVSGRDPLWTQPPDQPVVAGVRADRREVLVTRLVDAEPDHRHLLDGPSIWPLLTAMAATVGLVATIFTPWGMVLGAVLTLATLTGWFWPHRVARPMGAEW